jgi:tripartite-type tricarboxylate transporter receptor subunit TctC
VRTFALKTLLQAAALAAIGIGAAAVQDYPTRPITIIAPFPPGGPSDAVARILAGPLEAALGQPVVIENIAGAGGTIGVTRVARAEPDGYTLLIGQWSTQVVNPVTYHLATDVVNDFAPIALLANTPQIIIARKDFPASDVRGLIAWLKANPTRRRLRPSARRAARRSPACISSRSPARASASCLIAAALRRCRT